ncbi:MAG TPA: energy-coupling factor ABC transporter permease [Candidatus Limnocylindrales bacterium]|nr:energy-coupling factor ABC transporter permease [Candidatus Limnocylindrales bacterium]
MHIPDGFLAAPVWGTLDAAAVPAVAVIARRAQRGFDESKVPLLGVMGAFVFAAQMINFPVGVGTTGHLVGGTLLACTLGPGPAAVAMTVIIAIQALVFQDGGILALGPNILNMAVFGVLAGYLPYAIWGAGPRRKTAIFLGGALSVMVSALLALSELLLSGVRMPGPVLGLSLLLFAVSAALEGAITVAVMQALETIQPDFVRQRQPARAGSSLFGIVAIAAILLACVGVLFAATSPDGINRLGIQTGIASRVQTLFTTPFSGYQTTFVQSAWVRKASSGLAGLAIIYAACIGLGRAAAARNRSL